MVCRFCKENLEGTQQVIVVLPPCASTYDPKTFSADDPKQSTFACNGCAIREGYICEIHDTVHIGFGANGHACISCIEREVIERCPEVLKLLNELRDAVAYQDLVELLEEAFEVSELIDFAGPVLACISRWIICTGYCLKITTDEVISRIRRTRDLTFILPHPLGLPPEPE